MSWIKNILVIKYILIICGALYLIVLQLITEMAVLVLLGFILKKIDKAIKKKK